MPIQFRCPGCSQPIEVDDPFAGKSAQCPYCRRVITVPEKTDIDAGSLVEARPSPGASLPPTPLSPPPLPPAAGGSYGTYSPPDPYGQPPGYGQQRVPSVHDRGREGVARVTGNLALTLTCLTIALFIGYIIMIVPAIPHMAKISASQPADPRQAEQILREAGINPNTMALLTSGMMFCVIAGLILGIVSWWQQRSANWRAWISVGVNAMFVLCMCFGLALMMAGAAAGF